MDVTDAPALEQAPTRARAVEELIERIRAGELDAFEEIIRLYERRVLSMAIQMGLTPQDSQDAAQEVFLRVFRYLGRFDRGRSFEAWIWKICVNVVFNSLRRRRDRGEVSWEALLGEGRAVRLDHRLQRAEVGLSGARAIRKELRAHRLLRTVPALATINRWLNAAGLIPGGEAKTKPPFYPAPVIGRDFAFAACDWTARYLEGGEKVFVFHTVDTHTHALAQSSSGDKSTTSVCAHLLRACARRGVPDFLQLDNDAAFTGLGKTPGVFGRFVRLALYLGIELIFIPPGEPERNALVEGIHHLWAQSFWRKKHFASVKAFQRKSPQFLAWYEDYEPPALHGLTVKEARKGIKRSKLTLRAIKQLPPDLPLTAGRLHFIRKVNERGVINLRKEAWKVSRRLAGEYVWATLDLSTERLEIYYRRSEKATAHVVKTHRYPIEGRVERVKPEYRRRTKRVRVVKIM